MSAKRWFIVTNTENLEFFFHCGLIVDKQGFPDRAYIADAMHNMPSGYIPCFPPTNLWDALKAAKADDENLTECLIELDIKQIHCSSAFCRTDELNEGLYNAFTIEKEIETNSQILTGVLLPAPLPMNCVKKIILKDSELKKSLTDKYKLAYGSSGGISITTTGKNLFNEPKNVVESNLPLKSDNDSAELTHLGESVPCRQLNYDKTFSYGGALSLLYYQTKNGRMSTEIFKDFSSDSLVSEKMKNITSLTGFFTNRTDCPNEADQLYTEIINCIYGYRDIGEARYNVLQLLDNPETLPSGYARDCVNLAKSLTQLIERTNTDESDTIFTKLIEHYEAKEPGRSKIFLLLTMFFVRDHSETMLKYHHSVFSEEDYALLALFFGAVNGFINTPSAIRKTHDLSTWLSFKMATYMHEQSQQDHMRFKEPLKNPFLIYDKGFKSSSTNIKLHDFYEWFGENIDIPIDEFVKWRITTKGKYTQEGATMEFNARQKQAAIVNFDRLEELMTTRTIKDVDELFDFNPIIDAYKKKS